MNLQDLMDGFGARMQKERAKSQMTLGVLIAELENLPADRRVVGLGTLASYRGYYSDLAFDPDGDRTVADLLAECRRAMGRVFGGYKGGDYQMGEATPLFVAGWGDCGPRLMALTTTNPIRPITEEEQWTP